jgi:indolepyruvate ferredoxin oxidoreductase beta subunit
MIGLEPLEAQRNQGFLHRDSRAVIDTHPVYPFSVNSGSARYPDTSSFIESLRPQIAQVLHIDSALKLPVTLRSLYVLGQASTLDNFPVSAHFLGEAITRSARPERRADHLDAFKHGCDQGTTIPVNAELARPPTEH